MGNIERWIIWSVGPIRRRGAKNALVVGPDVEHEDRGIRVVKASDYERLEAQLVGAVEDRDKLAAYLRWKLEPQKGPAPMTWDEMRAMVDRLAPPITRGQ